MTKIHIKNLFKNHFLTFNKQSINLLKEVTNLQFIKIFTDDRKNHKNKLKNEDISFHKKQIPKNETAFYRETSHKHGINPFYPIYIPYFHFFL